MRNLFKGLFVETNPIPAKAAMVLQGRVGPELRLPLTTLSKSNEEHLKAVLEELGAL